MRLVSIHRPRRLAQAGFSHIILPVVVVVAVGGVGAYTIVRSLAATACTAQTLQSGSKDSGSSHCVQYLQQMENGLTAYNDAVGLTVAEINAAPTSALNNSAAGFLIINNSFGTTSNNYDTSTKSAIAHTQSWTNTASLTQIQKYVSKSMTAATFASTIRPGGNLRTDGVTDNKTWYAMCKYTSLIPSSTEAVSNSSDFTGGKPNSGSTNKTTMWYVRSYMRAATTAASDANCSAAKATTTTTTTSKVPPTPTSVTTSQSGGSLIVKWKAVTATPAVKYYGLGLFNSAGTQIKLPNSQVPATATSATFSGATATSKGTAWVRACNTASPTVCSAWAKVAYTLNLTSTSSGGTTSSTIPPTPTNVKTKDSSGSLVVTWTDDPASAKIQYYGLGLFNSAGTQIKLPNSQVPATATSATFSGATATSKGTAWVRACNTASPTVCSAWAKVAYTL